MLTCHFYLLSNPVWPEMFGSQIYGFIFYGQDFTLIFFTVVTMSGVGRGRTEPGLSIRRLVSCSLAFARGLRVFSGTDAFSWMAFASFVYLTSKHRHYLFEMDLVRLVKGVQFATIDV